MRPNVFPATLPVLKLVYKLLNILREWISDRIFHLNANMHEAHESIICPRDPLTRFYLLLLSILLINSSCTPINRTANHDRDYNASCIRILRPIPIDNIISINELIKIRIDALTQNEALEILSYVYAQYCSYNPSNEIIDYCIGRDFSIKKTTGEMRCLIKIKVNQHDIIPHIARRMSRLSDYDSQTINQLLPQAPVWFYIAAISMEDNNLIYFDEEHGTVIIYDTIGAMLYIQHTFRQDSKPEPEPEEDNILWH